MPPPPLPPDHTPTPPPPPPPPTHTHLPRLMELNLPNSSFSHSVSLPAILSGFFVFTCISSRDPTYERGSGDIWLIPRASLMLITLQRETPKILGYFSTMTQYFLWRTCRLVISSQLCIQASYEFLMKPEESARCHQTLFLLVEWEVAVGE